MCVLTDMVPSLLSIKAYMSISVHNNIDCYTVTCIFFNTLKRHYTAIYLLFFCSHPSYLANRSAACFRLQRSLIQWPFACNCNRLLYCILFMICIDRFPSALCNVICLLRFTHPFPGAVPFQYMRSIFPAENRSLILSTWGIPVWKHVWYAGMKQCGLFHIRLKCRQTWLSFAPELSYFPFMFASHYFL